MDVAARPEMTVGSRDIRRHGGTWLAAGTLTAHGVAAPNSAHQVTAGKDLAARRLAVDITATATRNDTDD
jgi:polyisoprenoid-binding protein YceI